MILLFLLLLMFSVVTAPPAVKNRRSFEDWSLHDKVMHDKDDWSIFDTPSDCITFPGSTGCENKRYNFRTRPSTATKQNEEDKSAKEDKADQCDDDDLSNVQCASDKKLITSEDDIDKCFFHKERKTAREKKPRDFRSAVSTECDGQLESMKTIMDIDYGAPLFGAMNVLDLILCRGAGLCNLNFDDEAVVEEWREKKICQSHLNELGFNWELPAYQHILRPVPGKPPACSMNSEIGKKHTKRPVLESKSKRTLSKYEADAILTKFGRLVHPGIPMCESHKNFALSVLAQTNVESKGRFIDPPPATGILAESESIVDEAHNTCRTSQNDPDYHPPRVNTPRVFPDISEEVATAWTNLAKAADQTYISRKPFIELAHRTKRRKVKTGKTLLEVSITMLAPDNAEELKEMICDTQGNDLYARKLSKKYIRLMTSIADQYVNRHNRAEGYAILSVVSKTESITDFRQFIPDLSWHVFKESKRLDIVDNSRKRHQKEKYNAEAVHEFITFITGNNIMSPHTFGKKKSKYSDGTTVELANTIRMWSASRIIEMYKEYLKTLDKDLKLSDSTYYAILKTCSATPMKPSICVDYFLADAIEAADEIESILQEWQSAEYIDKDTYFELSRGVMESFEYLRFDYRLHVKMDSRIADHCGRHALSDPENEKFSSKCAHKHDLRCDKCEKAKNVLGDVRDQARFLAEIADEKCKKSKDACAQRDIFKDQEISITEAGEKFFELKQHFLRAKITDDQRSDIIENLQLNEAMMTIDFAQKMLPMKHVERQVDYFAKRGMSYHISHIVANVSYQYVTHSYVHILRGELQDSEAVTAIIAHTMDELKKMGILNVVIRSDNAGCYHSAATVSSMMYISQNSGVTIKRWAFSEVQNGKSSSDRVAVLVKQKVHTWISTKKKRNVRNVDEMFTALTSTEASRLLSATSIFLATVKRFPHQTKTKIAAISHLYDFSFDGAQMKAAKYDQIGEGTFIKKKDLVPNISCLEIEQKGGYLAENYKPEMERQQLEINGKSDFWFTTKCAKEKGCQNENEEEKLKPKIDDDDGGDCETDLNSNKLFQCPEPGCSAAYIHYNNLQTHITTGKHNIAPERVTLLDRSLNMYNSILEGVDQRRNRFVVEAIEEMIATKFETANLPNGWALRSRKMGKRFTEDARSFILELFEKGKETGVKYDEKKAAEFMKNAMTADGSKRFQPEERLNERQIKSLFGRLSQKDRYASNPRPKRNALEDGSENSKDYKVLQEEKEIFDKFEEDELSIDFELVFLKDPFTPSLDDEIRKIIYLNLDEIFLRESSSSRESH